MNTQTLVSEAIRLVGKTNFVLELDTIGWRGNYEADPEQYFIDYIFNSPMEDADEADEFVRNDVIVVLNAYGFDYTDGKITSIIVH